MAEPKSISTIYPKWRVFVRVAELGSATRAAVALDTHQSAISVQISALEKECGGRLFNRTGRGVTLTPLGERVLPRIQALIAEAERFSEDILTNGQVPHGEVKVGVVASTAQPLVGELFRRTRERFPGIRLNVREGFSDHLEEWLASGQIDIGLLHRYGRKLAPGEERLGGGSTYLIGKAGDPLCEAPQVEFSRLHQVPLALPAAPSGLRVLAEHLAHRRSVTLNVEVEVNSLGLIKDIVAGGGVYTVLPFQAVFAEVQSGSLWASQIVNPGVDRTVALGTNKLRPQSLAARETARLLFQIVRELVDRGTGILWDPAIASGRTP